jgi:hypothetical protein
MSEGWYGCADDGHPANADALSSQAMEPQASPPKASIPDAGDVTTIPYPFIRDTFNSFNGEDYVETPTWKPGIRYEAIGPEDSGAIADALGAAIFTVVDTFKPGRYPRRVFFTRQFINPDGKVFGKSRLHITTLEKFRRLTRGYQHPFGIGVPYDDRYQRKTTSQFIEELREYAKAMEDG